MKTSQLRRIKPSNITTMAAALLLSFSLSSVSVSTSAADSNSYQDMLSEAQQGGAYAQFNLGNMYRNGQGVRQDYATAKEWFGKACDNGEQAGCKGYALLNK